jgi:hypothetical protein
MKILMFLIILFIYFFCIYYIYDDTCIRINHLFFKLNNNINRLSSNILLTKIKDEFIVIGCVNNINVKKINSFISITNIFNCKKILVYNDKFINVFENITDINSLDIGISNFSHFKQYILTLLNKY